MYIQYGVLACACLPAPGTVAGTPDDDDGRVGAPVRGVLPARPARAPATSCCMTVLSAEATASAGMLGSTTGIEDEVPGVEGRLPL